MIKKIIATLFLVICTCIYININAQMCFDPYINISVGADPKSIISADFNGDGILDLAMANYGSRSVSILLGTGGGNFGTAFNYMTSYRPHCVISADFNNDSKLDLALSSYASDSISLLLGTGTGSFGLSTYFVGTNGGSASILSADFNGDGNADIAKPHLGTDNLSILLGTGTGSFSSSTISASLNGPLSITSADYNGDSIADLAIANYNGGNVSVFLGNGSGSFAPSVYYSVGPYPSNIISADFNGDSKPDLVFDHFIVLLNTGTGNFTSPISYGVNGPIISGDFNVDGKADIAIGGFGDVKIALGLGTGSFNPLIVFPTDTCYTLTSGDFNGDGLTDIATADNISNNASILLSCTSVHITNESSQVEDLSIIPNPSSGIFTIEYTHYSSMNICIRDVFGKCVWNKEYMNNSNPKVDLSNESKGNYFMEIIADGKREVKKIVLN
ncbi:MAG: T9SS type A sorting domain-containing protein [Bacteroidota bacterium]